MNLYEEKKTFTWKILALHTHTNKTQNKHTHSQSWLWNIFPHTFGFPQEKHVSLTDRCSLLP